MLIAVKKPVSIALGFLAIAYSSSSAANTSNIDSACIAPSQVAFTLAKKEKSQQTASAHLLSSYQSKCSKDDAYKHLIATRVESDAILMKKLPAKLLVTKR